MFVLKYEMHDNIPVFKSNLCGKCTNMLESTSYASAMNRGCCWYFPKYTLVDIKNILSIDKKDYLLSIIKNDFCTMNSYSFELKGYFNKNSYEQYMNHKEHKNQSDFDEKLFFKICPLAAKKGCSIDFSLRPHPCNLYLCREIVNICKNQYENYKKERKDYFAYCNYFDEVLREELDCNNINLINDFDKSLAAIENYDLPLFEPRSLAPIMFNMHNSDLSLNIAT